MKGKSVIELKGVLHKDLILVITPSYFFYTIIDGIEKRVLSTLVASRKEGIKEIDLVFDTILVYTLSDKFTTIPSALFNEEKINDYLNFTTTLGEDSLIFFDKVEIEKMVIIWSVENQVKKDVVNNFSGAVFKTILSPFIKRTNSYGFENKISSLFFEDRLIISVFKKGDMQLINTFEIKSVEDALYYHLLLFQSIELNEEEIEIVTGGIYKEMDLFLSKLKAYFSNINRVEDSSSNNNNIDHSFLEIVESIN